MKFDKNLAAIHGYLCGDGYVIKNPETQKHKYYYIGFRNTNLTLLKDFQNRFFNFFKIKPIITKDKDRCKIQNKELYKILTKKYSYYSYEWTLPKLSKESLKSWLKAFFDCEAWVYNKPRQSRVIGLDCCNYEGLLQIKKALAKFSINSRIKKKKNRVIWNLSIFGLENLKIFKVNINFTHPEKYIKLDNALNSYVTYDWTIPENKDELIKFIKQKGKFRESRDEIRFISIKKGNLHNLKKVLNKYNFISNVFGPWTSGQGSEYYCLIIKHGGRFYERTKNWASARDKADK
jgi:hypothetical protein